MNWNIPERAFNDTVVENERRKIIITGGTEGIGNAIAKDLFAGGGDIAICARTKEAVDRFSRENEGTFAIQTDLSDRHAAASFVGESIRDLGGLDALILNAAVTGMTEDDREVFMVNQVAQVAMTREAADALKKSHGRVVFLSSAAKNIEGAETYGESKKRIEAWLEEFSMRPENEGIGIFSVIPGSCDTKMHRNVLEHGMGAVRERTELIVKEGALRDPKIVGRIISKMAMSGMRFNPETGEYDVPIGQCEVVTVSDENIEAEQSRSTMKAER